MPSPTVQGQVGLTRILKNLYAEIEGIKGRTLTGMIQGVRFIHKDCDATMPLVPERTGNLKQSWFLVSSRGKILDGYGAHFRPEIDPGYPTPSGAKKAARMEADHFQMINVMADVAESMADEGPTVIFGYTAFYAILVHEMYASAEWRPEWTRPGSGPHWLDASVKRNKGVVLGRIMATARLPK